MRAAIGQGGVWTDLLVERARRGDPDAFVALIEERQVAMSRTATAILGNEADVADACRKPWSRSGESCPLTERLRNLYDSVVLDDVTTWQGDSRELLAGVADHSVDLICTDPPYNLGGYSRGNIKMAWRSDFNNDVAAWDHVAFEPAEWLAEFRRVLKPSGTIFAFTSYNMLGRWHEVFDPAFDTFQFIVWHKTNPPPKLRRVGFLNSCELIVCCWDKGHTWNFTRQRDMHNFIEGPICSGNERVKDPVHPTQKPLRVLRRLVELASSPGDLVLDPFMGVGSTGVAAVELGRRFVGIEIDEGYVAAARRRIDVATAKIAAAG